MPNHFHLLLKESVDGGISLFMQKLGTSFAMYYNVRYAHVGNVFVKPFRSKHVGDDAYLQKVAQYIHLNPAELYEPGWKKGVVHNLNALQKRISAYRYSSISDHLGKTRLENAIVDLDAIPIVATPPLRVIVEEAAAYYAELNL